MLLSAIVADGTWETGRPANGPNAAHAGTNCSAAFLAGDPADDANGWLASLPFVKGVVVPFLDMQAMTKSHRFHHMQRIGP